MVRWRRKTPPLVVDGSKATPPVTQLRNQTPKINARKAHLLTHQKSALAQAGSISISTPDLHLNKIKHLAVGMDSAVNIVRSETSVTETTIKAPQSDQWSTRVPACNHQTQATGPRVDDLFQGYTAGQKPGRIAQLLTPLAFLDALTRRKRPCCKPQPPRMQHPSTTI